VAVAILLPGILMPAPLRYERLLAALGDDVEAVTKDLELYGTHEIPATYTLEAELDGLDRFADALGARRFHLYGHSAGGAIAIAYVARSPERVLSLAVDEPASDFSDDERARSRGTDMVAIERSDEELMAGFARGMVAPGVELAATPPGPPPAWMANRPAGVRAFVCALHAADVDREALRSYAGPVYYSHGGMSDERWEQMRDRIAAVFPDFTSEVYEERHHMDTSHMAEPDRVASRLRDLWHRAEM
jgi:pimeloyl-ACP methyl ester carboxylesterase